MLLGASGFAQVIHRLGIHREKAHGRAIFGGHVGNGGPIHHRERSCSGAVEFDKLADDFGFAQHFGDGEREVGGGDAFATMRRSSEPHHVGCEKINRLAQHAGLGFDATHAPTNNAEAVDHGGVGIGADERVGIINGGNGRVASTPLARYSRFTWWTMPIPGGTTLKVSKACMPHLRNW